ncbi:MAG: serine protease [Dysgonamonadaceae bacterium]|jgi:hypothetical protein|nr:serine protease [Dysgonamonadaceae bacterium]
MKHSRLFFLLLSLLPCFSAYTQISHGGIPYFQQSGLLRTESEPAFFEMPAFDIDSVLRAAEPAGELRSAFQFAYKFYTDIDLRRDATISLLPDGTKIRRITIRSKGAYSINLLLRDFEIPEGGKLFVYNTDYSYVIGSFDHRNNSPGKILPLQPVEGEAIIVEYSEPPGLTFEGYFRITEVNHDYRGFLRSEPKPDSNSEYRCMPDALCSEVDEEMVRSTVLLIINGNTSCTGTLVNNTADDGRPYLLTAVHCLCSPSEFPQEMEYYTEKGGTIIAFFNYNRPVCGTKMKGTEEMSMAITRPLVILEKNDVALLEFQEAPPDYYNPYYAGWNRTATGGEAPYTNLHHPWSAVKKTSLSANNVTLGTIGKPLDSYFIPDAHWSIAWTTGSTYAGSSGSPLFDKDHLLIGGLSGGSSVCNKEAPGGGTDYFFALCRAWETDNPVNQLKTYLDPLNKDIQTYPGLNPKLSDPVVRLGNALYNSGDELITSTFDAPNSGFVFGNSNLQTLEFAEEFTVTDAATVYGAYIFLPEMSFSYTNGIEISVYAGNTGPETLLYSTPFVPKYLNYSNALGFHPADKELYTVPTESFVVFDEPVNVKKKFFISYKIKFSTTDGFCVYNTKFGSDSRPNTAWLKEEETNNWMPADAYSYKPVKTALAIQALIRNRHSVSTDAIATKKFPFYFDRSTGVLTLWNNENETGWIEIYSIGGTIMEKFHFNSGPASFALSKKTGGTVGIVKINGSKSSHAAKIIY